MRYLMALFVLTLTCQAAHLQPNEILVVVNGDLSDSAQIGQDYCRKRQVPIENLIPLSLGNKLADRISRRDYDRKIAEPLRNNILYRKRAGDIRCLLLIYGVPYRVNGRGALPQDAGVIEKAKEALAREQEANKAVGQKHSPLSRQLEASLARLQGKETNASVDSELAMVLFPNYELYRWQPNALRESLEPIGWRTLMVSRLDGPSSDIAAGLVDKALHAESQGLQGHVYIDARGMDQQQNTYGVYDRDLVQWAEALQQHDKLTVHLDRSSELFAPGTCPDTALYCGWYSLKHYVDAFDFVPGAIGYHIASFEAEHLHQSNSPQWCPAMLRDGITATLGPVAEPYLHAFPRPSEFFGALLDGDCLVEGYAKTNPFNSWQLLLIGDPLYRPFASDNND